MKWLPRLEAEHGNFRVALEWGLDHNVEAALRLAGSLSAFWFRRAHSAVGINWIKEAQTRAEQLPQSQGEAARRGMRIQSKAWQALATLAYYDFEGYVPIGQQIDWEGPSPQNHWPVSPGRDGEYTVSYDLVRNPIGVTPVHICNGRTRPVRVRV